MIAGAIERHPGFGQTPEGVGKGGARRIQDREMKKPGCAARRRRAAFALPGIETDVMMIAAGGERKPPAGRSAA